MTSLRVRRDGDLWWLGRDRPEKHNALDEAMVGEIDAVLQAAGADIAELKNRGADAALLAMNAGLFERLEAHCWPTIALVDGPALGGGCARSHSSGSAVSDPPQQPSISLLRRCCSTATTNTSA
jgi:enoyl-CoA hydratase/carnithine racemase